MGSSSLLKFCIKLHCKMLLVNFHFWATERNWHLLWRLFSHRHTVWNTIAVYMGRGSVLLGGLHSSKGRVIKKPHNPNFIVYWERSFVSTQIQYLFVLKITEIKKTKSTYQLICIKVKKIVKKIPRHLLVKRIKVDIPMFCKWTFSINSSYTIFAPVLFERLIQSDMPVALAL